jgi:hypothetical protein
MYSIDQLTSGSPTLTATYPNYDPTVRPWYEVFTKNITDTYLKTVSSPNEFFCRWSEVYAFAEHGNPLGLTLSCPIFEGDRDDFQLVSVLGIDFRLQALNQRLIEIKNETGDDEINFWIFERESLFTIATTVEYNTVNGGNQSYTVDSETGNRTIVTDDDFSNTNNCENKIR